MLDIAICDLSVAVTKRYPHKTYHDRPSALFKSLNTEFPSTWNWPDPTAVTAGAAMPPSAPVNVCRLVDDEEAADVVAAVCG